MRLIQILNSFINKEIALDIKKKNVSIITRLKIVLCQKDGNISFSSSKNRKLPMKAKKHILCC